ncbi:iron-containing alcohol dehydrogenase [Frigidibacter mobilis]|uniref:Dehydrogenase n=1 Tax=Frigidibacter mobilis TaxID=1335048 RepID=A0A159Z4N3_9RHOB|nr:iron-containing alcohol dehydrogenase [Frigidibacter mobilis]AMY70126.1 dehydrogenase [Frigidibacter mobilis]
MINRILTPRELLVGGGARHKLAGLLQSLGVQCPLVVTDPTMVKVGHAGEMMDGLTVAGFEAGLFAEVVEDPTDLSVAALVAAATAGGHDGLVALGGGSAIDTAKAAGIALATGEPLSALKVPRIVDIGAMPLVAIPTTAGTGSEVTRAAVITDTGANEKMLILGATALPTAAIVDYELTFTCPFRVTVDTGIDALTHALEALVNRNANPHSDALALSGLALIGAHLETAAREPQNAAAREAVMLGAMQAGLAVSNTSTALIHGMSRPIGAFFHVPHGMSNAMVLPLVTQFSIAAAPAKYAMAARALGLALASVPDAEASLQLVTAFQDLNRRLEVPTPRRFGIEPDRYRELIPEMTRQGIASGTPANNPRVPTPDEIARLYTLAFDGELDPDL